jgi:pimeloyl-ACP methyl ester carboxylesterase
MRRSPWSLPGFAAILAAVLPVMGCADNAEYLTEDRLNNGLVIILPGIEGHSQLNENIRRGLVAGGVYRAIPIHPWGRPVPLVGPLITQVDFLGNRLAGIGIAKIVTDYQDKYPDRPVYIVGHSGGGGVAVFTAEAMPEGRQIDGLVLLSASISSAYDLKKALSHCRNGIVNFYNKGDAGLLGFGTIVVGTVDGTHGPSAGLIGFDAFEKPGYEGLYQVKMVGVSEDSHTTSTQAVFVSGFVAPWVLSDNWPAGVGDAYVDGSGPLPKPPAGGDQLARATAAKPANGKVVAAVPPAKPAPAATGKAVVVAKAQAGRHVDESLLAAARARNSPAKQNPAPLRTHPTAAPRLPTDETIDPDESSGKARGPGRASRDETPADTRAEMLPTTPDPEDEADPAAIAPIPAEESAGQPKADPRFRRW